MKIKSTPFVPPLIVATGGISSRLYQRHISATLNLQQVEVAALTFPRIVSRRLARSLRVYRKRSGLSQREASFLLGVKHGGKVSRYEQRRRIPPLRTALAYSIILNVPLPQLFPHLQREAQSEVAGRILELQGKFAAHERKRGSRRAARMAEWLKQRHAQLTTNN